jgi:WD40 repeat protein
MLAPLLLIAAIAVSPDGKITASGSFHQTTLADAAGKTIATLAGQSDVVRALAFSPDGRWLAAAGGAPARFGQVQLWDVASRKLVREWRGHEDAIYSVAFSPDGKTLATGSYDKLVKLWDPTTGAELRTLKDHIDAVFCVAFSPDGARLASASADRTVKVWDPATGQRVYTLSESTEAVHAVAFSPNGKQIAAGGADKSIRIWNIAGGTAADDTSARGTAAGDGAAASKGGDNAYLAQSVVAHEDAILQLVYSRDGVHIATSSADKSVKIWDAATLTELRMEQEPDWVMALAYAPDGKHVALGGFGGRVTWLVDQAAGQ